MVELDGPLTDCVAACPHLRSVQGSCAHDLRPLIMEYFREHPGEPCPVYDALRAREMAALEAELGFR